VARLYCGKETGARDSPRNGEIRRPVHRKYGEHLRETLDRAAAPEPFPGGSDSWMPSPAAEAVAREARLSVAKALFGNAAPKPAILRPFKVAAAPAELWVAADAAPAAVITRQRIVPKPGMPEPGFIPPDFHCANVRGAAVDRLEWQAPKMAPFPPSFDLRLALDHGLENLVPKKAAPKTRRPRGAGMYRVVDTIAAGLLVSAGLWFGSYAARTMRSTAAVDQDLTAAMGAAPARTTPAPQTVAGKRPLDRVRSAISKRAAVQFSDTFHEGMESWNAPPKSLPPGWSRHPDGYVQTGQLALYHPSAAYSNYRLEFFGQIESKSMGWVVRAHDMQNYYAMKFTVVEPGLRPIIAMVHYPVVGGKKGNRVEVPLSVMVHNDTAYHVTVEVEGNRMITSIEGLEVDRWTDDTLASGGVGFFSEPGERARLYWMKLAANDDWLGRICGYLSGGSETGSETTAQWRRGSGADTPHPGSGSGNLRQVAILCASRREFRNRRIQVWGFPREPSQTIRPRSLPA